MTPSRWDGGFPEHQPRRAGPSPWRAKGKRPFGETWWGKAWIGALEGQARLDKNRLPRGRTYARTGAVGTIEVAPGRISAPVQGSRATPYRVKLRIAEFTEVEWERVLDALAAEIGHVAALVDGELVPSIADDVRSAGLDLLPGPGELRCECSCPDWAEPCKHSAAVCYCMADSLDEDPFGVLLMRGRSREDVLAALRARRGGGVAGAPRAERERDPIDRGVNARDTWARSRSRPPRAAPAPVELPRRPGRPTVLAADPPPGIGIEPEGLRELAADAAERALALGRGAPGAGVELGFDARTDLARRAAALIGDGTFAGDTGSAGRSGGAGLGGTAGEGGGAVIQGLARRAGMPARDLLWRAVAYRDGGACGLAVFEEAWDPGSPALAAGIAALGSGAVGRRNRVTLGARQLRLGRDGQWYPYRKGRVSAWVPDGPPVDLTSEVGDLE